MADDHKTGSGSSNGRMLSDDDIPGTSSAMTQQSEQSIFEEDMKTDESESLIETEISPSTAKHFSVKKFQAVACWSWDVDVEICPICRNDLHEACIECQAEELPEGDCTVAWGVCNHAFHLHCISRWLKTRSVCPLDNKEWDYQKLGR